MPWPDHSSRTRSASGTPRALAMSLAVVMLGENHPASSSPRYLGSIAVAWSLPFLLRATAGMREATSSSVRFCACRCWRTAWPKARAVGSGSARRRGTPGRTSVSGGRMN